MGVFQADEEAKVVSPEVQGCNLAFCLAPSSQDPEFPYLTVTEAEAAFSPRIPNKPLIV